MLHRDLMKFVNFSMRALWDFIWDYSTWWIGFIIIYFAILPMIFGDCKDKSANNYNPNAWFDNHGKCEYTPLTPKELQEIIKLFNEGDSDNCGSIYDYDSCINNGCTWEVVDAMGNGFCTD